MNDCERIKENSAIVDAFNKNFVEVGARIIQE